LLKTVPPSDDDSNDSSVDSIIGRDNDKETEANEAKKTGEPANANPFKRAPTEAARDGLRPSTPGSRQKNQHNSNMTARQSGRGNKAIVPAPSTQPHNAMPPPSRRKCLQTGNMSCY
jgi:hypothetical protein